MSLIRRLFEWAFCKHEWEVDHPVCEQGFWRDWHYTIYYCPKCDSSKIRHRHYVYGYKRER
jgi:hypothetical protein